VTERKEKENKNNGAKIEKKIEKTNQRDVAVDSVLIKYRDSQRQTKKNEKTCQPKPYINMLESSSLIPKQKSPL